MTNLLKHSIPINALPGHVAARNVRRRTYSIPATRARQFWAAWTYAKTLHGMTRYFAICVTWPGGDMQQQLTVFLKAVHARLERRVPGYVPATLYAHECSGVDGLHTHLLIWAPLDASAVEGLVAKVAEGRRCRSWHVQPCRNDGAAHYLVKDCTDPATRTALGIPTTPKFRPGGRNGDGLGGEILGKRIGWSVSLGTAERRRWKAERPDAGYRGGHSALRPPKARPEPAGGSWTRSGSSPPPILARPHQKAFNGALAEATP